MSLIYSSHFVWHSYCALLNSHMQSCLTTLSNNPSSWLSFFEPREDLYALHLMPFPLLYLHCFFALSFFLFPISYVDANFVNNHQSKLIKSFWTQAFFVLKSHWHSNIFSNSKDSDVTKARSYNKGVANILPSPTHPPLEKRKKHCASSAYTQFPSIQSGDPVERTGRSGCLWGAYRMGGGGRISATPIVISLPHLLHTRSTSKRRPIWRATQSHLSAITTAPEPPTFSKMDLLHGIPKRVLGPSSKSKPTVRLVSTLKTYPGCWKLQDFCQSHLPMRKETSRKPAGTSASHLLSLHPMTSKFLRCGFWPRELIHPGISCPLNTQVQLVRMVWERPFAPFYPGRSRKRAAVV